MRKLPLVLALASCFAASSAAAANVRSERPRILFGKSGGPGITLDQYKTRCNATDGTYKRCKASLGSDGTTLPGASLSAKYLVTGDASACSAAYDKLQTWGAQTPGMPDAHSFIVQYGRPTVDAAIVRDWCDGGLSDAQKKWIEDHLVAVVDWYLTQDPLDVYHDDAANVWSGVAISALTLKGTSQDAKASAYLTKAEDKWKNVLVPAMKQEGDWWHEGFTYIQPTIGGAAWWAAAWSTATDDDVGTTYKDWLEGYIAMHAYALRPDKKYVYFGDTSDNKQSVELFSRWLVDLLSYSSRSALGVGVSLEIKADSRDFYDYPGADSWLMSLLFDDSKAASAPKLDSLPTARWLSKGGQDVVVLRSGWGKDDTYVWMTCGDYYGAHQRMESGSFQIFHKGILTGSTGYYDNFDTDHWVNYYSQHSVHANTLAIVQPGEIFPNSSTLSGGANVNDGGQRPLRRSKEGNAYPSTDLATYLKNKTSGPHYETGDLKTFEHASCHDYVACDVTAAYNSPMHATNGNKPKVDEVSRQLVFFPPDLVLVFDRVEATDASYDKRFLLHVLGTQDVKGSTFTLSQGDGKLLGQTLLPADPDVNVITNFQVEGKAHPPSTAGAESGGTRLEISPKKESTRDVFLHVFVAGDASTTAPTAKVDDAGDKATATIDHGGKTYVVSFAKTGALAGHVTVTSGGATVCDKDLGKEGTGPLPDGGIPTDDGGTTPGDDAGSGNGATPDASGGDSGGCGCRVATTSLDHRAALVIVLLFTPLLRRQNRTRTRRAHSASGRRSSDTPPTAD